MVFHDVDFSDLGTNFYYLYVPLYVHPVLVTLVVAATAIVSFGTRITGKRMSRRIKNGLGRPATEGDLLSIHTSMKVDRTERPKNPDLEWVAGSETRTGLRENRAFVPESADAYVQLVDYDRMMNWRTRHEQSISLMDVPVRLFRIKYTSQAKQKE
jgi:hypothetical protein